MAFVSKSKQVVQLILEQLIEKHEEYMNYYIVNLTDEQKKQKTNQPWVTDSDIFVEEAMDFFENREFNKDIVDILVSHIRCIRDQYIHISEGN